MKINKDTSEVRRLRSVKTATDSFEREERENKEQMEVLSAFVRDRTISYVISESNVKCAFLTKLLTPQAKTLFLDKTKNAYVSTQLCVMGYLLSNVLLSGFQVRSSSTGESINGNSFVSFVNPSMEDSLATDPVLTCTTFFEPGIYQSIYGKGSVFDKKVLLASEECIRRRIAADIEGTPVSSESEGDAYTRTILTYNSL